MVVGTTQHKSQANNKNNHKTKQNKIKWNKEGDGKPWRSQALNVWWAWTHVCERERVLRKRPERRMYRFVCGVVCTHMYCIYAYIWFILLYTLFKCQRYFSHFGRWIGFRWFLFIYFVLVIVVVFRFLNSTINNNNKHYSNSFHCAYENLYDGNVWEKNESDDATSRINLYNIVLWHGMAGHGMLWCGAARCIASSWDFERFNIATDLIVQYFFARYW